MQIDILPYTKERISDVINFEENLRRQENFWGWKIDQAYRENVCLLYTSDAADE